jgi:phage terminase large subunit-like protein
MSLTARQESARKMISGPQRHSMLVGGSRSGKTFLFTRQVAVRAIKAPDSRHVIFRLRFNALRASVWLDTFPKMMRSCFPDIPYEDHRQDGYTEFPNGSQIWWAGLDDKERVEKILGMEFATEYFNECSQIPYASVLTAHTRLAQRVPDLQNRAFYDLNPVGTAHWSYRLFIEGVDPVSRLPLPNPGQYQHLYINPNDNRDNIDPEYIASLEAMPERQRRRFLDGRYVADIDGALWTLEILERQRIDKEDLPAMNRIVVAVDPSGASGPEDYRSDEIGIVVAGLGVDGFGYVLADLSGRYSPEKWGKIACDARKQWGADRIIGEKNYGGDMVRAVIQSADRNAPVKLITASRGKMQRAEPVSALYEQGKIFHVGTFTQMEDQMTNFSTAGYLGDRSPDRADAGVWALSELMIGENNDAFLEFARQRIEKFKQMDREDRAA